MRELTAAEHEVLQTTGRCPFCGGRKFIEGSRGGMSVNLYCLNEACGAGFNLHAGGLFPGELIRESKRGAGVDVDLDARSVIERGWTPCRDYDPPSLWCAECRRGHPERCTDPLAPGTAPRSGWVRDGAKPKGDWLAIPVGLAIGFLIVIAIVTIVKLLQ